MRTVRLTFGDPMMRPDLAIFFRKSRLAIVNGFVALVALGANAYAQAPVITSISAPRQVVNIGQNVTLNATVTGATSLQWQRSGRPIAGATGASFTVTSASPVRDNGWYRVLATNGSGTTASAVVFVNVSVPVPKVVGWGSNSHGQLSPPAGLANVVSLAASQRHAHAVLSNGTIVAWGDNFNGLNSLPAGLTDVVASSECSGGFALALRSDGTVVRWGSNVITMPSPALSNVVAVAAGGSHMVALIADGTVVVSGDNNQFGQLNVPAGLSGVVAIAAGFWHTVALKNDGTVIAWGWNDYGQCNIPPTLGNVSDIATGYAHGLAMRNDGSVVGWGANDLGQTLIPPGLSSAIGLRSHWSHAVAVKADGTVASWGQSSSGQTNVPFNLANVVGTAVGIDFSLALRDAAGDAAPVFSSANNATFVVGSPGLFTVSATGTPAASFSVVAGAMPSWAFLNSTTGVISGTPPNATGSPFTFTLQATNGVGTPATQAFTLTAGSLPAITAQLPSAPTLYVGQSTSYMLMATGTAPLSYQWRKAGVPIAGETASAIFLSNVQFSSGGIYDVVVSNPFGSVVSNPMSLTVLAPTAPSITAQPVGAILNTGNVASFSVSATGVPLPTFQWRKNSVSIAGATSGVYVLGAVNSGSAGSYDVVVSNVGGSVVSNAAVLAVNPPVYFTAHPTSATLYVGGNVTLTSAATGTPTVPTYQWRKNGAPIAGATNSSLTLSSVQTGDAGSYDVVATNTVSSATSNAAVLTVTDSAPQITQQPAGATVALGSAFSFSVGAVGSRPLSYQWRRNGLSVSGATNATLVIPNAQSPDAGLYSVLVSNSLGSVLSSEVTFTVVPRVVSFSSRLMVEPAGAFGVFTVEGPAAKKILLRAVGPGLTPFGVTGVVSDPQLELFDSAATLVALNNDWSSSPDVVEITNTTAAVGAFSLNPGSRDSAIVRTLAPGSYTVRARPASGAGGTALLELYDADLATGAATSLPFVALRGRMGSDGVFIGGLGSMTRGVRSYLLRAVGPALGLPGAVTNPSLLVQREGTLVGNNDNWDANAIEAAAITAATARVAAFALPAGGLDSAVVLTGNLRPSGTMQVNGGSSNLILIELHDLDAARPTNFAPIVVSGPVDTTVSTGDALTLRVLAHGTAPLNYQWRKDGANIAGATTATLAFSSIQPLSGGQYSVAVGNAHGSFASVPALLSVQGASTATHALVGSGYVSGGPVTITNTFSYSGTPSSLGWTAVLPAGWSFVSDAGSAGDVKPFVGATGSLDWAWSTPPAGPISFTYTVNVPAGTSGSQVISAIGVLRTSGSPVLTTATPSPLAVPQLAAHSADTNADYRISLIELTRVIELYNTRNGTTRTGRYKVQDGTEDGFEIDPITAGTGPVVLTRYHSGDTDRDGRLTLIELTRVIELYNTRSGTTRTGQYRVQTGTEDGYAPGP